LIAMWVGILVVIFGVILIIAEYGGKGEVSYGDLGLSGPIAIVVIIFGIILLAL